MKLVIILKYVVYKCLPASFCRIAFQTIYSRYVNCNQKKTPANVYRLTDTKLTGFSYVTLNVFKFAENLIF